MNEPADNRTDPVIRELLEKGRRRLTGEVPHELPFTLEECCDIRVAAGLTQRDIAEVIGVSGSTIGRWETGAGPLTGPNAKAYVDIILALARAEAPEEGAP